MMRKFVITMAVFVDTHHNQDAKQILTDALCSSTGGENGSIKVLSMHKQRQIPALFRAKKGITYGRNSQRQEIG